MAEVNDARALPADGRAAAEVVRGLLDYDAESGVFRWRSRCGNPAFNGRYAGTVAGAPTTFGHLRITIGGRAYQLHRLAWLVSYDQWPSGIIDHINGDPADNRLANLRPADPSQSSANVRIGTRNTTGFKGVSMLPNGRYRAAIKWRGVDHHLGCFGTAEEAHAAYCRASEKLHGEFGRVA